VKHRLILLVALAAITAGALSSAASSGGGKTLDLTGTVTGRRIALDAKPAGLSPGDIGYETGIVFDQSEWGASRASALRCRDRASSARSPSGFPAARSLSRPGTVRASTWARRHSRPSSAARVGTSAPEARDATASSVRASSPSTSSCSRDPRPAPKGPPRRVLRPSGPFLRHCIGILRGNVVGSLATSNVAHRHC
jgi:hypothetical protein